LFNGRGAKSVRSAQHNALPFLLKTIGQLADTGGLARAVYAHHKNHTRSVAVQGGAFLKNIHASRLRQNAHDVRFNFTLQLFRVG